MKRTLVAVIIILNFISGFSQVNILWNDRWIFKNASFEQVANEMDEQSFDREYCSSGYYEDKIVATDGKGVYYDGDFLAFDDTSEVDSVPAILAKLADTADQYFVVVKPLLAKNSVKFYLLKSETFDNWTSLTLLQSFYQASNITSYLSTFYDFSGPISSFDTVFVLVNSNNIGKLYRFSLKLSDVIVDSANISFNGRDYSSMSFCKNDDTLFFAGRSNDSLIWGYFEQTPQARLYEKKADYVFKFQPQDRGLVLLNTKVYFLRGNSLMVKDLLDEDDTAKVIKTFATYPQQLVMGYDGSIYVFFSYKLVRFFPGYPNVREKLEFYGGQNNKQFMPDGLYPIFSFKNTKPYMVNDSAHFVFYSNYKLSDKNLSFSKDSIFYSGKDTLKCFLADTQQIVDIEIDFSPNNFYNSTQGDYDTSLYTSFYVYANNSPTWPFSLTSIYLPDFNLSINPGYNYDKILWFYNGTLIKQDTVGYHVIWPGEYTVYAKTGDNIALLNSSKFYYSPDSVLNDSTIKLYYSFDSLTWYLAPDNLYADTATLMYLKLDLPSDLQGLTYFWLINGKVDTGTVVNVQLRDGNNFVSVFANFQGFGYKREMLIQTSRLFKPVYIPQIMLFDTATKFLKFLPPDSMSYVNLKSKDTAYCFLRNQLPSYRASWEFQGDTTGQLLFDNCCSSNVGKFLSKDMHLVLDLRSFQINGSKFYLIKGQDSVLLYTFPVNIEDTAYVVFRKPLIFSDTSQQTLGQYLGSLESVDTLYWMDRILTGKIYVVDKQFFAPEDAFSNLGDTLDLRDFKFVFSTKQGFSNFNFYRFNVELEAFPSIKLSPLDVDLDSNKLNNLLSINRLAPNLYTVKANGDFNQTIATYQIGDSLTPCKSIDFNVIKLTGQNVLFWNGCFVIGDEIYDFTKDYTYYLDTSLTVSSSAFYYNKFFGLSTHGLLVMDKNSENLSSANRYFINFLRTADTISEAPILLKLNNLQNLSYLVSLVLGHGNLYFYLTDYTFLDLDKDTVIQPVDSITGIGKILTAFYPQRDSQVDITKAFCVVERNNNVSFIALAVDSLGNLKITPQDWLTLDYEPVASAFSPDSPYVYALASNSKLYFYKVVLNQSEQIQSLTLINSIGYTGVRAIELASDSIAYFCDSAKIYGYNLNNGQLKQVYTSYYDEPLDFLQLTPNDKIIFGTTKGWIGEINDLEHITNAFVIDQYLANNIRLNYPSGLFPFASISYDQDSLIYYQNADFHVRSKYPGYWLSTKIILNDGDSVNTADLTTKIDKINYKLNYQVIYNKRVIASFGPNDDSIFTNTMPYKVYVKFDNWKKEYWCLDTPDVLLQVPDYDYDSIYWTYNGQRLEDYDGDTSLLAKFPGYYTVNMYFQGGEYRELSTSIHYVPESIFDSLQIHYQLTLSDGRSFVDTNYVELAPDKDYKVKIKWLITDTANTLRDARVIEPYFLYEGKLTKADSLSVDLGSVGDRLLVAMLKYKDKFYLRRITFKRDFKPLVSDSVIRIPYRKKFMLYFASDRFGYNYDSSAYYVKVLPLKPEYVVAEEYGTNDYIQDLPTTSLNFVFYTADLIPASKNIGVYTESETKLIENLYVQPQGVSDSSYLIFDFPVYFSNSADTTLSQVVSKMQPTGQYYFFTDSIRKVLVYHIPYGIYSPQNIQLQVINSTDGLYIQTTDNSFEEPFYSIFYKLKSDLSDLQDVNLYDNANDVANSTAPIDETNISTSGFGGAGSFNIQKLSDTTFELETFRILVSTRGTFLFTANFRSSYLEDTLHYEIYGIKDIPHFGGNFLLTPNGDGYNDYIDIGQLIKFFGLNLGNNYKISIINSKGVVIAKLKNADLSQFLNWRGKINNRQLPSGVYWFLISDYKNVYYFTVTIIR